MSWEKTTIGDHCTVTSSKRIHLADRLTNGIPFYCSKEIIEKVSGQRIRDCDYISEDTYEDIERTFGVPRQGDLLITTRGSFGIPYIYRSTDKFYFADGNLTWLKNFDSELLPHFLYYWILSYEGQKKIEAIAKGTAQKAVPIAAIKNLAICLPPIETQHRIASILSAYDDLIENNRKQIKLLEEAAQRLYKEWFVDLRFPGHENVAVVDGVPEGWRTGRADDFFIITIGKTPPRSESEWFCTTNGIPWISITDMGKTPSLFISDTNEQLTREAVLRHNVKVIPAGTVLLSFKLTVGRVSIITCNMCTNEAIAHFWIEKSIVREYACLYLKMFEYDTLGSTSSISKAINSKIVKSMPFIMPDDSLLKEFHSVMAPIFGQMALTHKNIQLLTEARDRLLPKLMSGEVEV